ncbi:hypothetical protein cyc_07155 [Cyclospora cayetanensis]|uniref:Uncharacterized protein n=1 Tax=Cyclospora cayetanensis TaxID=88456 RepID=A0A1D3CTY0_9EIME|nr:hypothetical protein cyc_07155 [Cyclospora cayetanensis]
MENGSRKDTQLRMLASQFDVAGSSETKQRLIVASQSVAGSKVSPLHPPLREDASDLSASSMQGFGDTTESSKGAPLKPSAVIERDEALLMDRSAVSFIKAPDASRASYYGSLGFGDEKQVDKRVLLSAGEFGASQQDPAEWFFPQSIVDAELLHLETRDYVSTGNCFYSLGPKAVVESLCDSQTESDIQQTASPNLNANESILIAIDRIKGLYDSPTNLLQWDSSQRTSASISCTQIGKLPSVQYATVLSLWSELLLYQKSQVILVVGEPPQNKDRTVPSLLCGFGLVIGSTVKEQTWFASRIRRIYDAVTMWSTVVSNTYDNASVCRWRWSLGFCSNGKARNISLSGALLSDGPPADEGSFVIVLHIVQCALSDYATPQILGIPKLPLQVLQSSLLHGDAVHIKTGSHTSKGLSAVSEELQAALGFSTAEAVAAVRICLAYWILSKGISLRPEDADVTEILLGSQAGSVQSLIQQCTGNQEDVLRHLRNALYDDLFEHVVNLTNKSLQSAFQQLVSAIPLAPQGKALQIIIEESPYSKFAKDRLSFRGLACRAFEVLQLAFAFRGLHNLQRIMETDSVKLPPYLESIRRTPQTQLLVQILFSRYGGLIPFLAQEPRKPADVSRWMAWMTEKPYIREVLRVMPNGSLLVDWLGSWASTSLMELTAASWTVDGYTYSKIESLLCSASATRMCKNMIHPGYALRLFHAVKDSLATELVERPVLVVRSSDSRLVNWTHQELRIVEDWQSFGFPVLARLSDLPKYCPHLFEMGMFYGHEESWQVLAEYLNTEDFAVGKALIFARSSAYNALYGFELAAKAIEKDRENRLQTLRAQWDKLQTLKAELYGGAYMEILPEQMLSEPVVNDVIPGILLRPSSVASSASPGKTVYPHKSTESSIASMKVSDSTESDEHNNISLSAREPLQRGESCSNLCQRTHSHSVQTATSSNILPQSSLLFRESLNEPNASDLKPSSSLDSAPASLASALPRFLPSKSNGGQPSPPTAKNSCSRLPPQVMSTSSPETDSTNKNMEAAFAHGDPSKPNMVESYSCQTPLGKTPVSGKTVTQKLPSAIGGGMSTDAEDAKDENAIYTEKMAGEEAQQGLEPTDAAGSGSPVEEKHMLRICTVDAEGEEKACENPVTQNEEVASPNTDDISSCELPCSSTNTEDPARALSRGADGQNGEVQEASAEGLVHEEIERNSDAQHPQSNVASESDDAQEQEQTSKYETAYVALNFP